MVLRTSVISILLLTASAQAQTSTRDAELYALAKTNLSAFAVAVTGGSSSELPQASAIVAWLAKNFAWTATDYRPKTVQEIIERKGGNCNELAQVAVAAMKTLKIPMRKVHEINIYTWTPERGDRAHQMVREKGNRYSVFGRHHNDHVWIEIYDSKAGEWFPADPSIGVVGTEDWLKSRVWFGPRFTLDPISNDMIVPFVIAAEDEHGDLSVDRTQYYLVDAFNRLYGGKLSACKDWSIWKQQLRALTGPGIGAFRGEVNLHTYESQIDSLAAVYERLRAEFSALPR